MNDENKPKYCTYTSAAPDEYKVCVEEMKKNLDKFIETFGDTKIHPWQKDFLNIFRQLKLKKIVIPMPKRDRFEPRVCYGKYSVAIPDYRGVIINNIYIDEYDERVLGKLPFECKKNKQTISRRQFKKWAKRLLKKAIQC